MFDWVDHTAELELRIEAETQSGVFADAARALRELLEDADGGDGPTGSALGHEVGRTGESEAVVREIALEAPDRARLLAEWLEELVFLAETEGFVLEEVNDVEISVGRVRAALRGRRASPRHLVKAVTYHRLAFEPAGRGWRATVVFDV